MTNTFKQCLWSNFGAAIDMLKNAVLLCPDEIWHKEEKFFYIAYHTTIFLDYYLTIPVSHFSPTLPYIIVNKDELPDGAIDDVIPNRYYSREEVLLYLTSIRTKCEQLITQASEVELSSRWITKDEMDMHDLCPSIVEEYTVLEILFYNLRHVQHHVAQLNYILRQKINSAPDWVSQVE